MGNVERYYMKLSGAKTANGERTPGTSVKLEGELDKKNKEIWNMNDCA